MVFSSISGKKIALVLDQEDNDGAALTDSAAGDVCNVVEYNGTEDEVTIIDSISFGHKFALLDLSKDQAVLKYGEKIEKMKESIIICTLIVRRILTFQIKKLLSS